jgi:hypothetical protein
VVFGRENTIFLTWLRISNSGSHLSWNAIWNEKSLRLR